MSKEGIELNNIKNYLNKHGVKVDEVFMWQGGFRHEGTKIGCDIIVTCYIGNDRIKYAVPRHALNYGNNIPYLKL